MHEKRNGVGSPGMKKKYNKRRVAGKKALPRLGRSGLKFSSDETRKQLKSMLAENKKHRKKTRRERKARARIGSFHDEVMGTSAGLQSKPHPGSVMGAHTGLRPKPHPKFSSEGPQSHAYVIHQMNTGPTREGKLPSPQYPPRSATSLLPSRSSSVGSDWSFEERRTGVQKTVLLYWKASGGARDGRIDFSVYSTIYRLVLASLIGNIEPGACRELIEKVWRHDNRNEPSMTETVFADTLVQISRVYLGGAPSDPLCENMLHRLFHCITASGTFMNADAIKIFQGTSSEQRQNLLNFLLAKAAKVPPQYERVGSAATTARMLDSRGGTRQLSTAGGRSELSSSVSTPTNLPKSREGLEGSMPPPTSFAEQKIDIMPWTPAVLEQETPKDDDDDGAGSSILAHSYSSHFRKAEAFLVQNGEGASGDAFNSSLLVPPTYDSNEGLSGSMAYTPIPGESTGGESFPETPLAQSGLPLGGGDHGNAQYLDKSWDEAVFPRPLPPTGTVAFNAQQHHPSHRGECYPEKDIGSVIEATTIATPSVFDYEQKDLRHPVFLTHVQDGKRLVAKVEELVNRVDSSAVPECYKEKASIHHQLLLYLGNSACCSEHRQLMFTLARFYNTLFADTYVAVMKEVESLRWALKKSMKNSVDQSQRVKRFVNKASDSTSSSLLKKTLMGWKEATLSRSKHNMKLNSVLNSHSRKSVLKARFKMWHGNVLAWKKVREAIANASRVVDESYFARVEMERLREVVGSINRERQEQEKRTAQREDTFVVKLENAMDEIDAIDEALKGLEGKLGRHAGGGSIVQRLYAMEDQVVGTKGALADAQTQTRRRRKNRPEKQELEAPTFTVTTGGAAVVVDVPVPVTTMLGGDKGDGENEGEAVQGALENPKGEASATVKAKGTKGKPKTKEALLPKGHGLPPVPPSQTSNKDAVSGGAGSWDEDDGDQSSYESEHSEDVDEEEPSEELLSFFNFFASNTHADALLHKDLRFLWKYMDIVPFKKGDKIIKQNETATWVGCIVTGSLSVVVNNDPVATLVAGEMVGELGWYEAQKRTADVDGLEDGVMAALHYAKVEDLLSANPSVGMKFTSFLGGNAIEKLRGRVKALSRRGSRPASRVATPSNNGQAATLSTSQGTAPTSQASKQNSAPETKATKRNIQKASKKKWLSSNTEVFYRTKVATSKRLADEAREDAEAEKTKADKARNDRRREIVLRKGLEKTVAELEMYVQKLEGQLAFQRQQMETLQQQQQEASSLNKK
jgi:hypothetical protein